MGKKAKGRFRTVKVLYRRFIRIRGNPKAVALGFALGIFIGFTPTMGIQMIIAVFLAALVGWNKIAAGIAVWITNAFTAPFIYTATYLVGAKLIGINNNFQFPREMSVELLINLAKKAPSLMGALTVGGVVVGLPAAAIAYFLSHRLIRLYQLRLEEKLKIRRGIAQQKSELETH